VWVYLGRGVATNALPRDDTLSYFLSSERGIRALNFRRSLVAKRYLLLFYPK